jgi:hypothetical protein
LPEVPIIIGEGLEATWCHAADTECEPEPSDLDVLQAAINDNRGVDSDDDSAYEGICSCSTTASGNVVEAESDDELELGAVLPSDLVKGHVGFDDESTQDGEGELSENGVYYDGLNVTYDAPVFPPPPLSSSRLSLPSTAENDPNAFNQCLLLRLREPPTLDVKMGSVVKDFCRPGHPVSCRTGSLVH